MNVPGSNGGGQPPQPETPGRPTFGQRVDRIGASASQVVDEARGAVADLVRAVDLPGRVGRNPYGMVSLAAGVGYLLGGGLFTPLTGSAVRLSLRLAALPLVKDELAHLATAAMDAFAGAAEPRSRAEPSGPPGG